MSSAARSLEAGSNFPAHKKRVGECHSPTLFCKIKKARTARSGHRGQKGARFPYVIDFQKSRSYNDFTEKKIQESMTCKFSSLGKEHVKCSQLLSGTTLKCRLTRGKSRRV
ncbi:MAG: hypothetical protein FWF77_01090 [Defluviitaleaceae bacterium]|nr:hypothetical protein [Defluviitaleaceae bacterium]